MKDRSAKNLKKSMDRGSVEQGSRLHEHDGDIMTLAKKEVISVPPSTSIKEAAEKMADHKFRRLPVTDPGTDKLLGIVTSMDILNFLGGGEKFNLMEEKHHDNFLAAINEPIRQIMTRDVKFMTHKDSIVECVIEMLNSNVGAFPIVDNDKNRKLIGIITERDFTFAMAGILTDELVEDFMTEKIITTHPGTPIEGSTKIMVRNKLRRIPVLGKDEKASHPEEKLVGIVTANDVLEFLGDNKLFTKMESPSGLDVLNTKISEIMEKKVFTVEPLTRLGDLCELFNENDIGGVPVVKNDKVLGIITERDVLKAIRTTKN